MHNFAPLHVFDVASYLWTVVILQVWAWMNWMISRSDRVIKEDEDGTKFLISQKSRSHCSFSVFRCRLNDSFSDISTVYFLFRSNASFFFIFNTSHSFRFGNELARMERSIKIILLSLIQWQLLSLVSDTISRIITIEKVISHQLVIFRTWNVLQHSLSALGFKVF